MTADRPEDIGASTAAPWQLSVERVGDDAALVHLAGKLEESRESAARIPRGWCSNSRRAARSAALPSK